MRPGAILLLVITMLKKSRQKTKEKHLQDLRYALFFILAQNRDTLC